MIFDYIRGWRNHNVSLLTLIENLLGNLLLFAPMGLFLPCIFKKMDKFWKYLLSILFLSIAVESLQLITGSGKCDVDDLILNLAGAVVFYGFFHLPPIKKLLQKVHMKERPALAKKPGEA
jgi:glycopeptide antibiotics resistance protein